MDITSRSVNSLILTCNTVIRSKTLAVFVCLLFSFQQIIPTFSSVDFDYIPRPEFLEAPKDLNITSFIGHTTRLPCTIRHLGTKRVSWIRGRDLQVLSTGRTTFATDIRISILPGTSSSKRPKRATNLSEIYFNNHMINVVHSITDDDTTKTGKLLSAKQNIQRRSTGKYKNIGPKSPILIHSSKTPSGETTVKRTVVPYNYLDGLWEPEDYTLQIKYTKRSDAGRYICQINTEPRMSQTIRLKVIYMVAKITGKKELFVKEGSPVTLSCAVSHGAVLPGFIFWFKNGQIVDYASSRGRVQVKMDRNGRSDLLLSQAVANDSANYTCSPSGGKPDSATLTVIVDERPAAMQQGNGCQAVTILSALQYFSILICFGVSNHNVDFTQLTSTVVSAFKHFRLFVQWFIFQSSINIFPMKIRV